MTKTELESLGLWDIIFHTIDEQGKERLWTTVSKIDHSSLCEGWKTQDFKERK